MKRIICALLCAAMVLSLMGCGTYTTGTTDESSTASTETAESSGTASESEESSEEVNLNGSGSLTFVATEPVTLNLIQSNSNLDADVFYLISAMLYRPYDGEVYPELAEGYTESEDHTVFTYTIKDAAYTDGTPIVAADFVYYMIQKLDTTSAPRYKNGEAYINGECDASEVGIYATDDKTFVVELAEPLATFDPELEIYPLQQSFAEEQGDNLGGTPENFKYSGPYVLTEWVLNSYMTFEKNPDYIDAADSFPLASLKMISSTDENGRYNIFQSGEAQVLTSVSSTLYELLGDDVCTYVPSTAVQGLEFNTTGYYYDGTTFATRDEEVTRVLSNENFRKALSYALDREAIVAAVNPAGQAVNRYISNMTPGSTEGSTFGEEFPIDTVPLSGDEAAAQEYLAAALEELGYSSVEDIPTIEYLTFESDMYKMMAETIVSEWKRVLGFTDETVEIKMQPVQSAVMSMVYMDYDIYYQSLSSSFTDPQSTMAYWITGGSVSDVMQAGAPFSSIFSNSEYDELVENAKYEFDTVTRCQMLADADQILMDSFIYEPIMSNGSYCAVSSNVHGYVQPGTQNGYMFNHTTVDE